MECYLFIKTNKIESLVVMWMNIELVTQSEMSQKEKNKHIYMESRKMVPMNLFAGRSRDTDIESGLLGITIDGRGWDE